MDSSVTVASDDANGTIFPLGEPGPPRLPPWLLSRGRMWILPFLVPFDISIVAVVCGIIINTCGLVGNIAIIGGIITSPRLRKAYNVFIGSLAVNDFLAIIFSNMFQVISYGKRTWPFSYPLCVFHYFAFTQFNLSTVFHILAITVYRYIVVVHPAAGRRVSTKSTIIGLVTFLHALPIFIIVMPKIGHMDKFVFIPQMALCLPGPGTPGLPPIYLFASVGSLVVLSLFFTHLQIHHVIRSTESRLRQNELPSGGAKTARQKKHARVLKCMLIVFVLFSISYFPAIGIIMKQGPVTEHYKLMIAMCLSWLATGTNWIIYGVLDRDFREAYKRFLLFCRPGSRVSPMASQTVSGTLSQNANSSNVTAKPNRTMQTNM